MDASPVLLVQPRLPGPSARRQCKAGAAAASAQASEDGAEVHWWAFACSHSGEVLCSDGSCGEAVWRAQLPGRADAGLAVTADLKVTPYLACFAARYHDRIAWSREKKRPLVAADYDMTPCCCSCRQGARYLQAAVVACDHSLHFLSTTDGTSLGSFDTGGAVKACPAIDPWTGSVWATSHSHSFFVLDAAAKLLCSQELGSAVSTPAVFDAGHPSQPTVTRTFYKQVAARKLRTRADAERNMAYVTALDGSVFAFRCTAADSRAAPRVEELWRHRNPAPIFSTPAVVPGSGALIFADVEGRVTALAGTGLTPLPRCSVPQAQALTVEHTAAAGD